MLELSKEAREQLKAEMKEVRQQLDDGLITPEEYVNKLTDILVVFGRDDRLLVINTFRHAAFKRLIEDLDSVFTYLPY